MFPGRKWGPSYLSFLVSEFLVSYEAINSDRDRIYADQSRSWMIRPWQGQSRKRITCRIDRLLERCAKSFVLKISEKNCLALTSIVFKTPFLDHFLSLGKCHQQDQFELLLWQSGLYFGAWWQWYDHLVFPPQCFLLGQKLASCSGN